MIDLANSMNSISTEKKPEITIGIALYRDERRVFLSVSSAITQTESVKSIIICDDGNNQSLGTLFSNLDSRVVYKQNTKQYGMWKNIVQTYNCSKTRYFCWMGDDDFISPSFTTNIVKSIEKHPDCIAWMGLPNSHTVEWGTKMSGIIIPTKSNDPYSRVLDVFLQGQYGASFFSVVDTTKISIYPIERLLCWPYFQYSFDYIWMLNIAIQGNVFQEPSLLYFYDQTNWSKASQKLPTTPNLEDRLSVPLTYIAGLLLSMNSYLKKADKSKREKYGSKHSNIISWIKIIKMFVSKYLFRSISNSELTKIKKSQMNLKELLIFCSKLADMDHGDSIEAQKFFIELLEELEEHKVLTIILNQSYKKYSSFIWKEFPDFRLKVKKMKNLFKAAIRTNLNYAVWQDGSK